MSGDGNSYGTAGGGYATTMSFGEAPVPANGGGDVIVDTTTAQFSADVIQESRKRPVLVDFWAPWCGPCKQLTPVIEKVVKAAGGAVRLVKMNIDDHPQIAGQLGIQSIPAVIAFRDGQPVDGFMGALPESQVKEFVQRLVGPNGGLPEVSDALTAARQAREAGDLEGAAALYDSVLAQLPENIEAIAGLADALFEAGDAAAAGQVLDSTPEGKKEAPEIAGVRTRIALAREAEALGNPAELEARLAANPKDHDARFDLALIQNTLGRRDEAAENLLEIIRTDRAWRDDGARAQLVKLFEAWGPMDEATLSARRRLSSLLFS